MQLIKKYANRKLYHTNRKQYITLEGIAQLIQTDETVQVLDNESGEDITASTLAQVVLQARSSGGGLLPTKVLTGLIQTGGETLVNLRRSLFSSLGGLDLVEWEIERRLRALVAQGALAVEEADHIRRLLIASSPSIPELPPTSESSEIERLKAQLDTMTRTVEQLLEQRPHKS